jgi:drug/metabolite transporter (DMT)-like permease
VRARPPRERASQRAGVLFLITVVLAWGLTWPVNKLLLESLTPLWMLAARSAIATLALFVIALVLGRLAVPPRADVPVLLSITLLHMVGFGVLAAWGLQLVPTGRSVVLAYTTPLWVAPAASLFLGEPLTARRLAGMILGLLGLLVLFNPLAFDWANHRAVLGNGAILLAAALWAASILHIRGHAWQSTPFDLVPWEMLLATVIVTPLALALSDAPPTVWSGRLVGLLLFAGVPGTAVAYWATAMASQTLPAATTSLGLLATPVVSVVVATLWLGEPLTLPLLAAIVLILAGVALGTTGDAPMPATASAPSSERDTRGAAAPEPSRAARRPRSGR